MTAFGDRSMSQVPQLLQRLTGTHATVARADWVPFALRAAERLTGAFDRGRVLRLFDGSGRIVSCAGDAAALDRLATLDCRPEEIASAAAVPLRAHAAGEVLGMIDILRYGGYRARAASDTAGLAQRLAATVQQMLQARERQLQLALLHRFAELSATYADDALVAIDRDGRLLHATRRARWTLGADADTHVAMTATGFPVLADGDTAGVCLLLHGANRGYPTSVSVPTDITAYRPAGVIPPPANAAPLDRRIGMRRATTRLDERRGGGSAGPWTRTTATSCTFRDIVGTHPRITDAIDVAIEASGNTRPVFITGESGTGKRMFAQAIHAASDRHDLPFVVVSCASLACEVAATDRVQSTGIGFSGARPDGAAGLERAFCAASGGTIFLDDVRALPSDAQVALLRLLHAQELTAARGVSAHPTDVRIIASSTRSRDDAADDDRLRRDLSVRLSVLPIELPSLRDRPSDVPGLARHFLDAAAAEFGRPALTVAPAVLDILARNAWPGNVRELRHVVRRLASLCIGNCITIGQLPPGILGGATATPRKPDTEVHAPPSLSAMPYPLSPIRYSLSPIVRPNRG